MAGSYNHVVTDDGNLGSNEFVVEMLENGGDVYEAVEQMYGMIWWLAEALRMESGGTSAESVRGHVEAAQQYYRDGLEVARRVNEGR